MIDAREDVMTAPASQNRRRTATVSASRSTKPAKAATGKSLPVKRVFSDAKINPFDQIEWDKRTAEITAGLKWRKFTHTLSIITLLNLLHLLDSILSSTASYHGCWAKTNISWIYRLN